jgi:hypothetical protein
MGHNEILVETGRVGKFYDEIYPGYLMFRRTGYDGTIVEFKR